MLIRRRTLEQIGLLPEDYFFGGEDVDYSLQTLRHNLRIAVARRASVWHKVSTTAGPSMRVTGIGQHLHKGWQILRRKYLSTPGYVLSTFCGLMRQAFVGFGMLSRAIWHRDFREVSVLLRHTTGAVNGMIKGLFQLKPNR